MIGYYEKRFRAGALPAVELMRPVTCRGARLVRYGVREERGASVVYGTVEAPEEAAAEHLFTLWVKSVLLGVLLETAPAHLAPAVELQALAEDFCRDRALADLENTVYSSDELAPEDQVRVSRVLWELIWEHKVFLLFGRSPLLGLSNGEDRFVKY